MLGRVWAFVLEETVKFSPQTVVNAYSGSVTTERKKGGVKYREVGMDHLLKRNRIYITGGELPENRIGLKALNLYHAYWLIFRLV